MGINNLPLRQTDSWGRFMELIGWQAKRCDSALVLIKKFPFGLGSFIKILDLDRVPPWGEIFEICRRQRCWAIHVQTVFKEGSQEARKVVEELEKNSFRRSCPLSPSKTIWIDLTKTPDELLADFRPAVRTDLRRAEKLGLEVERSDDIEVFAKFWRSQMRRKGDWLAGTKEIEALWRAFKDQAWLLITKSGGGRGEVNAGVLLIENSKVIHYMYAVSTPEANLRKAPTRLVWESLKLGQKLGCHRFDFEGVYDLRFAGQQKSWRGFSRFKEGFGGVPVVYLSPFRKRFFPFLPSPPSSPS